MQIRKRSVAKQTILDFVNDRVACPEGGGEEELPAQRLLSFPWKGTQLPDLSFQGRDGRDQQPNFLYFFFFSFFTPLPERYVITVLRDRSISRESER